MQRITGQYNTGRKLLSHNIYKRLLKLSEDMTSKEIHELNNIIDQYIISTNEIDERRLIKGVIKIAIQYVPDSNTRQSFIISENIKSAVVYVNKTNMASRFFDCVLEINKRGYSADCFTG